MSEASPKPPYNYDAEEAIVGSAMVYEHAYDAARLSPEDFYDTFLSDIWGRIGTIVERGKKVSATLLLDQLQGSELLADAGGKKAVESLLDAAVPIPSVKSLADIVREDSQRRRLMRIGDEIKALSISEDIGEAMVQAENVLFGLGGDEGEDDAVEAGAAYEAAMANMVKDDDQQGVSTGIPTLDRQLGPMRPGDFVVVAARPSIGKTVVGLEVAMNVAARGQRTLFFSLEMPKVQIGERMASSMVDRMGKDAPAYFDIARGACNQFELLALQDAGPELNKMKLVIDARPKLSVLQIRSFARKMKRRSKSGLRLLVVDYMGLIRPHIDRRGSRYMEVTDISEALKQIAKELEVPIICLCQLNRESANRSDNRPKISDLRDSGAIEQDADKIILLHREAYYAAQEPEPKREDDRSEWLARKSSRVMEMIVAKNRGGPTGLVKVEADVMRSRIKEMN